jgi:hypothetical protein
MSIQMSKAAFVEMMRAERAHWESLLSMMDEEQMKEAGVEGHWSVIDIVAHVTAYERWLVDWLDAAEQGKLPPPSVLDNPNVDERNAVIYEQNHSRPLHEIWIDSQQTFDQLIRKVEALDERDLTDTKRTGWFVRPYWKESVPLWQCIAGDSYEHYHQHLPAIRSWLAKRWSE